MGRHYTDRFLYAQRTGSGILTSMSIGSPDRAPLLNSVRALCPNVAEDILQDFFSRMDQEYFQRFDPVTIAAHIRLAAQLNSDRPCTIACSEQHETRFEITIVAYDYFAEFATICGLLSAFGLNIEEGDIYTFAEKAAPPPSRASWTGYGPRVRARGTPDLSRKKIVDVFRVLPMPGKEWDSGQQARLEEGLHSVIALLDKGHFAEARFAVNRRLVEQLGKRRGSFSGLLHPVQITFDNSQSATDTVMDIRSDDTPAFLYAFANALAMRNIYISKAQFDVERGKIHDRFYVRNRHGQKLTDSTDQQQLRLTAVLIKQFTHALTWAPDPTKALEAFDQFLDLTMQQAKGKAQQEALAFLSDKKAFPLLARLLGASDFLWEDFLRRQYSNLLPLLQDYRDAPLMRPRAKLRKELDRLVNRADTDEDRKAALNSFKDRELFRIDMKHIVETDTTLPDFSAALTQLAEVIVDRSLKDCQAKLNRLYGPPRLANNKKPCPFTVLGLGKFGGRELGYASDIEVMFVYGDAGRTGGKNPIENSEYFERLGHELLQWIEAKQEGIFHLDVRLRPHGGKGSLTNHFDEIAKYYSDRGLAAPFERQSLIKLRHVAGDPALGKRVEGHRDSYVYSGKPWDLRTALDLRRQQLKELVERDTVNLKHSPGGIVDIEYAVQYLQIMHGHRRTVLRTSNTMQALAALVDCGLVTRQDGDDLRKAYFFIRMLIDGLRMVRGNAKDRILPPVGSDEFIFLARRVGYTTDDWRAGAKHLKSDIEDHMGKVKAFFERTFGKV
ncbi:MAG: hypothetical protein KF693_18660 [Nitrospira sp.]|nr:hypothetical protein [Nitrospira sp.]